MTEPLETKKQAVKAWHAVLSPVLLMCSPDFYEIPEPDPDAGYANSFAIKGREEYLKDPAGFREIAKKQWQALKEIFNTLGVDTIEMTPIENLPDQVFTADPSLSLITTTGKEAQRSEAKAITILSLFSNEERQDEQKATVSFIEEEVPSRPMVQSHFRTEGTGDNVYDPFRDIFWSGFVPDPSRKTADSGRSDLRAHAVLKAVTGVPVVSMAVKKPFFHIDTSMAPLSNGHIICYKDGMRREAFEKLLQEGLDRYGLSREEYLIEVSKEDAAAYACNLRCVGDTIVMPLCSNELQETLRDKGYKVLTTDLSHFIYSGGAVHCLTNNLNESRVVGGVARQQGIKPKKLNMV